MVAETVLALNEETLIDEWHWILDCLRDVLIESGDKELANTLPVPGQKQASTISSTILSI
jgi:hypothetical protein